MDALFQTIRESASPGVWSKGVELARQDTVTGDSAAGGEIVLRVLVKGVGVSPTVTLVPGDGDWACTCGGPEDPCAHVAAAVIALKRAREQGLDLPRSSAAAGKLAYRFTRTAEGLGFEREVVGDGGVAPLTVALSALTSGRLKGPPLTATAEDMEVELALGSARRGVLPAASFPRLLRALAKGLAVTLDGAAVAIDPAPVSLVVDVHDDGPGVRLSARQDPAIVELFRNGVALCASGLRPVVLPALTPAEEQLLRSGRFYGPRELPELVGSVLPPLEAKLPVRLHAQSLPGRSRARPQLELELQQAGERLLVTPRIVYGDPPTARVEQGRLTALAAAVPVRDPDAELRLRDELRRGLDLELERPVSFALAEAVGFVERLTRSRDLKAQVAGDGRAAFALHPALVPAVSIDAEALALGFTAPGRPEPESPGAGGPRQVDPAAVLAAWQRGEPLVRLLDGGFAPVPSAWLDRYGERLLELLAAREPSGRLARAALPALADLAGELGAPVPAALAGLRDRLAGITELPRAALPDGLAHVLRGYQRDGVDWLAYLRSVGLGALLADDMGLGKTLQAAAALAGRTLVVAPTSVLFNWRAELARFRPGLTVCLYHGPDRWLDRSADVVVTTYALLRLDTDALAAEPWDTLVLDEAQAIKNPESQLARAAGRLPARFRMALSGTPVENRLDDLWSVMQFLNPGLLGDRRAFLERYARPILAGDLARAAALRARVRPFILRRLKRDVAPELPPRTETVLHVELSPAEREHYEIIRAATRRDVVARLAAGGSVLEALEALLRLRQASCHPDLLPGVSGRASAKLALLVETLEESVAEGHRALVFSQWTSFLDLIQAALRGAGLAHLRLDGATADRAGVVAAFQKDGGPPILLMSLKAGGVGLNLTAADHVILTDPWWNPAAEDQAADRAHRIGQERPVLVQRLVALDTVEEKILALQRAKRALADAVIGEGGGGAGAALTRQDLLALLDG